MLYTFLVTGLPRGKVELDFHPGDDMIDQVGGRLRHAPGAAGGAKPAPLTGERHRRRSNRDVAGPRGSGREQRFGSEESRDGCFTGHELLLGAVGAMQAQKAMG
jgi:hypothetical protein